MKRLIFFVMLFSVLLFSGCNNVFTPQDTNMVQGDDGLTSGITQILPPGCTVNEVKIAKSAIHTDRATYPTAKQIYVPYRKQEKSYWCGPASAQMVQYYFGDTTSQTYIANWVGTTTDGTNMWSLTNWFNDPPMTGTGALPSWWVWECYKLSSYANFKNQVQWSFAGYSAPEVWPLRTYSSDGLYHLPGYTSSKEHYVTGSGYDFSGTEKVTYNDPYLGDPAGKQIQVPAYTMYMCLSAWLGGYIIY